MKGVGNSDLVDMRLGQVCRIVLVVQALSHDRSDQSNGCLRARRDRALEFLRMTVRNMSVEDLEIARVDDMSM